MRHARRIVPLLACAFGALLVACDDSDGSPSTDGSVPDEAVMPDGPPPEPTAPMTDSAPANAPAGQRLEGFTVSITAPERALAVRVVRGGGHVDGARETTLTSGSDGMVAIPWVLGPAPVDNVLEVSVAEAPELPPLSITVRGTLDAPIRAEPFADVHGFLDAEGYSGGLESTEDLAFGPDGLMLGVPGGLVHVAPDGTVTRRPVDEGIARLWGFAYDLEGYIWGVDIEGDRMVRIAPDGSYEDRLDMVDGELLAGPNYVAVDHDGRVYLTDPCRGEIIRLDPSTDEIRVHRFDLLTEGGPNGLAVSPDGTRMYAATENTGLLCSHEEVPIQEEIAGVYVIDLDDFGNHTPLAEGIGLFGDGLAFDAEGNLYVVVDRIANFQLESSVIVVFPAGESEGVDFLVAAERQIFANVAFGEGDYGETTLYIALLAVPGFSNPDSRGLERFDVGIAGLPLLPPQ